MSPLPPRRAARAARGAAQRAARGSAVGADLAGGGHRGRGVSRRAAAGPDDLGADVTPTEGAIAACAGAAVVYQCAQPKYGRWAEEFPGLTRTILAGVEAAGA